MADIGEVKIPIRLEIENLDEIEAALHKLFTSMMSDSAMRDLLRDALAEAIRKEISVPNLVSLLGKFGGGSKS